MIIMVYVYILFKVWLLLKYASKQTVGYEHLES